MLLFSTWFTSGSICCLQKFKWQWKHDTCQSLEHTFVLLRHNIHPTSLKLKDQPEPKLFMPLIKRSRYAFSVGVFSCNMGRIQPWRHHRGMLTWTWQSLAAKVKIHLCLDQTSTNSIWQQWFWRWRVWRMRNCSISVGSIFVRDWSSDRQWKAWFLRNQKMKRPSMTETDNEKADSYEVWRRRDPEWPMWPKAACFFVVW